MAPTPRLSAIAEALEWLEEVFYDPTGVGECSVEDAAVSLASEFVGQYRDEEITGRLAKLSAAESAGRPKEAARHLRFVQRKISARWSLEGPSNAAKALVAASQNAGTGVQTPGMGTGDRTPEMAAASC